MKYTKIRSGNNTWTCKCGNFYYRSTIYCKDCYKGSLWEIIKKWLGANKK